MKIKEFKTWDEQVAKLIEHGCKDIKSNEYAIDILQKVNYYSLIIRSFYRYNFVSVFPGN